MAMVFFSGTCVAQKEQVTQPVDNVVEGDTTMTTILKELQAIRQFQVKSDEERERIRKKHEQEMEAESKEDLSNEYGAMLKIADNTEQDIVRDGWNVYGTITIVIAIFALIVAWISYVYTKRTYEAQMMTEEHTSNAPVEVQQWKLKDLPRHFYRNLVCTCAIIIRYRFEGKGGKRLRYPSEGNLLKLQTMPDDIVLPIDVDKNVDAEHNAYKHMHELKFLLRNYNVEVEVASDHLSRSSITDESLSCDFDNLLFKPLHLTQSTFSFERALPVPQDEDLVLRTVAIMVREHYKKLRIPSNFNMLFGKQAMRYLDDLLDGDVVKNFREVVDEKDGLDRSLDSLLSNSKNYGADNVSQAAIEKVLKELKPEEKAYYLGTEGKDGSQRIPGILSITSKEEFNAFYHANYPGNAGRDTKQLYKNMAPYLNYLNSKKWEVNIFLKYMLAVDAAIEADRIGMVNFS